MAIVQKTLLLLYLLTSVCGSLPLETTTEGLNYVGCYNAWNGNGALKVNTNTFLTDMTLEKCSAFCKTTDTSQSPNRIYMLRGWYCGCMSWSNFNHVMVEDTQCHLECPETLPCGGNSAFSFFCDTAEDERCKDFELSHFPPNTQIQVPAPIPELQFQSIVPPIYPCFRCTNLYACYFNFNASYDYFPGNTPEVCQGFCRQRIQTGTGIELKTRAETQYAIVGWSNRAGISIPICWCTDELLETFSEVEGEECNVPCPTEPDLMCGGNPSNIFAMYCAVAEEESTPIPTTTEETKETTEFTDFPETTNPTTNKDAETSNIAETSSLETTATETSSPPTSTEASSTSPLETDSTVEGNEPTTMETTQREPETTAITTEVTTTEKIRSSTTANPCSVKCEKLGFQDYDWRACGGHLAENPCPKQQDNKEEAKACWQCSLEGMFVGEVPDYSQCSSPWFDEIEIGEDEVIEPEKANFIFDLIHSKTSDLSPDYYGHEISKIMEILEQVFDQLVEGIDLLGFEALIEKSIAISQYILINSQPWEELPMRNRSMDGTKLIGLIETTVFDLTNFTSRVSPTDLYRKYFASVDSGIKLESGAQSKSSLGDASLKFPFGEEFTGDSYIELPPGWANAVKEQNVSFVGASVASKFIKVIFPESLDKSDRILNGNLMSFSIDNEKGNTEFNGEGVKIRFQHDAITSRTKFKELRRRRHEGEVAKPVYESSSCVYWDTELLEWSTNGCKLVISEQYGTTCECSHLTSFAVLMDVHNYVGKERPLELLTLIICPLSVLCLAATIIAFTIFPSAHTPRTAITKSLCINLLVGNAAILLLVDRHYFNMSDGVCTAAAIVTHYVFLTAFMWMGVEGYHLYKMVVLVFETERNFINFYRVICYGLPLIIVGATCASSFINDGQAYGGEMFCWLQGGYIWTFLAPIAVIILGNSVSLFISLKTAKRVRNSSAKVHTKLRSYKKYARGTLSLNFVLGLTWVVGFLMMTGQVTSVIAAYIFTILNASQGIVIFILHCLLDEKVVSSAKRRNIPLPSWLPSRKNPTSQFASKSSKTENTKKTKEEEQQRANQDSDHSEGPELQAGGGRRRRSRAYDANATVSSLESFKTGSTSVATSYTSGNDSTAGSIVFSLKSDRGLEDESEL